MCWFYVKNVVELERDAPRLVINYKILYKVLQLIRYHIPNKQDLLKRLHSAVVYSKLDTKSGFWQVQIKEEDRYKTVFTVLFCHYELNVMPFGFKNVPSEFENIMNDIFNPNFQFIIVYINDALVFFLFIRKTFCSFKEVFQRN